MNKQMMVVSVVCLAAGLGGGGAATYMWLRASSGANAETRQSDHDDHDSADEEHDAHDENDDHGEEDDHGLIRLSSAELDEFGIEVQTAIGGQIVGLLTLPGEIVLNADQVAHIVPRVPGIVKRVDKRLGDDVKPTEVMAVLESRELAEAKAEYLAAGQRLALAQATFASSETLKGKGIMPELDFLAIRRERDEAQIEVRAAEYKLHALGLTDEEMARIPKEDDSAFSRYELRAPFAGTVIDKHITLGEVVTSDSDVFALADLSSVWVHLTVYQKDLPSVRAGQSVVVVFGHDIPDAYGTIDYVSPIVEETTRTATARIVLPNPQRQWRPGLFITGRLEVETVHAKVLVPKTALQTVEERLAVFVETEGGFELRWVTLGRSDDANVELVEGLAAGERYVAVGAFSLKAELGKEAFAGEGHAH